MRTVNMRTLFYGGVGEVGGNKVLIEDQDARIMLDFGVSYSGRRRYYIEPWLSPKDERGLLEFGILPDLKGLYRFDEAAPLVDGVFISHSHTDHASGISFLNRSIPVYCGLTAQAIIEGQAEMRPRSFETDLSGLKFQAFKTGDTLRVKGLEVKPIHVDHSVPGAYGFIVYTSEGTVVYTGDFRVHGSKSNLTWDFVEKAGEAKPMALICEGTNIGGAQVSSEEEVKSKIGEVVRKTDRLVLAEFSYADVDRFRTFHEVAVGTGRKLAISMRQAFIFEKLQQRSSLVLPRIDGETVIVYRKGKKRYYRWEESLLNRYDVKDSEEIARIQDQVILVCGLPDLKELIEIKPQPVSVFIHSASEPVDEEGLIEFDKLVNWLDHFGLPLYQIHCSGHIMPIELKEVISRIKPRKVHPIHTEHPAQFAGFVSAYAKVELPKLTAA
ncbi:MAG: MBL fold metallo-hydrolase [Thermoproteota archaeon]